MGFRRGWGVGERRRRGLCFNRELKENLRRAVKGRGKEREKEERRRKRKEIGESGEEERGKRRGNGKRG